MIERILRAKMSAFDGLAAAAAASPNAPLPDLGWSGPPARPKPSKIAE
jgi:hypothetical protein